MIDLAVYLIESKVDQQKLIDYVGEDTAKLFFSMKDRLKSPENDIYYWLKREPSELEDRLSELQVTKTRSQKEDEASKGAELIYNQNGWKVYHITTYEASVKYGKNTQWCISGSKRWSNGEYGEKYFNDYTSKGVEFYFYIKNNDEKYALACIPQNGYYQVFNQVDDDVSGKDLSFLPNVKRLPKFNYDDLLSEDGTYIYDGGTVPDKLRDKIKRVEVSDNVTEIGYNTFYYCTSLTSINIPDSVTEIGDYAFSCCTSLASINMSNGITEIGDRAFNSCHLLTSINIPSSVTGIGDYAFSYCTSLTSISIPDNVTEIGIFAFVGCTSLTSITIPNSVTEIGDGTFAKCESLKSIYVPDSVTYMGSLVFYKSTSLTVYTDNDYAIRYCNMYGVPYKPSSEFPG